jgi:hypothetical protein
MVVAVVVVGHPVVSRRAVVVGHPVVSRRAVVIPG